MKTVTVNVEYTDEYACPHCGELYTNHSLPQDVGETYVEVCDGQDGCGRKFEIKVVQAAG